MTTSHELTYSVVNFGCKVNRVESDTIDAALFSIGATRSKADLANVVVVNSCAVTGEAETKSRKAIHRILKNPQLKALYVTGCSSFLHPEMYESLDPRIIQVANKEALPSLIASDFNTNVPQIPYLRTGDSFASRVAIKVQDGCDNACTYCVIHIARGPARSIDSTRILEEIELLSRNGVREVILTGINLGAYKTSLCQNLSQLLALILEETTIERIRLSSIEPMDITPELLNLIAVSQGRIAAHFHLPLQSGSNKVLREMKRLYTADQYLETVNMIYGTLPHCSLTTDIIVGFPGETEADFAETLEMCKAARFTKIHAFRFSARPNTPAYERNDKIEPHIIQTRSEILRELGETLRKQDAKNRIGTTEFISIEKDGMGTSESYHRVLVEGALANTLVVAQIDSCEEDGTLIGHMVL